MAKRHFPVMAALLPDVLNGRFDPFAGGLPFDLAQKGQKRQNHFGHRFKCVNSVAYRHKITTKRLEQIFIDIAQIAQRTCEPIQFRNKHSRNCAIAVLNRAGHALKGWPFGVFGRKTAINEHFLEQPAFFSRTTLDFFMLRLKRKAVLGLYVGGNAAIPKHADFVICVT